VANLFQQTYACPSVASFHSQKTGGGPRPVLPDGEHIFKLKIPNLGNFCRVFKWKMLVYFMNIWSILQPFGLVYGNLVKVFCGNLVYLFPFWYAVPRTIWQPWPRLRICFAAGTAQVIIKTKRTHTYNFKPRLPDFSCYIVPKREKYTK
jgi:hypothetical protein